MLNTDAMPGQQHPAYDEVADMVRPFIDTSGEFALRLAQPGPSAAIALDATDMYPTQAVAPKIRTMRIMKCAGPAPWTYRSHNYWWFVAIDELGRSIGGNIVKLAPCGDGAVLINRWWTDSMVDSLPHYDEYAAS